MKVLFSSILIIILTTAAFAANEPGKVLQDYYRFSKEENLAAFYNVIDIQSMGPRELKTRRSITQSLWQRFDTLNYQIEDLKIEQDGDTAIAGYRLRATISGPDDSGRTAKLETDQKQAALLVLRGDSWKVALVSDEASFYVNLQNLFLLQQIKPTQQEAPAAQLTAKNSTATAEDQPAAPEQTAANAASDVTATDGIPAPKLITAKRDYQPGETITVRFSGIDRPASQDWVGLYGKGAGNKSYGEYFYLKKHREGELTFTAPVNEGTYEFRLFLDWPKGGYNDVARSQSIVVSKASAGTSPPVETKAQGSGGKSTTPGSATATGATAATAEAYRLVAQWGGKERDDGRFSTPIDVAVDNDGHVYVCDMSDRIQKFTAEGELIKTFAGQAAKDNTGRFNRPFGVAVDADNNVYVSDYSYNKIHKFNQELEYQQSWPQMEYNFGIAADAAGNIYVAEKRDNRLRKFDPDGNQLAVIGAAGNGADGLVDPYAVALDGDGNIFVVEQKKNRIQKLDPHGNPLAQWGNPGNKPGKFNRPYYLAVDGAGYVYVSDSGNRRVQKFDNHGNFVCQIGDSGSKADAVGDPAGIAVDAAGNIYVVDQSNHQLKKYAPVN